MTNLKVRMLATAATIAMLAAAALAQDAHEAMREEEDHGDASVVMTPAERESQGVQTVRVQSRALTNTVPAPGEVRVNAYRSAQVTPRITAQIVTRRARLGDAIETGQPLVTLSSVPMAQAQGALVEADREWQRVQALGREVVSEQRYVSAQIARQLSYAEVRAYGMTATQIDELLAGGNASLATGEFDLLSPQNGTVTYDEFVVGEVVEPGRMLFEVSDESTLWVDARLSPEDAAQVRIGSTARISRGGDGWLDGEVVQLQHRVDDTTRTRGVRIEVDNSSDALHPGDYVEVSLQTAATEARIAVPEAAILLFEGSPTVFKVEGDAVRAQAVEPGVTSSGWSEIQAGLAAGDEVVTQGAFLLKSLLLKSRMGTGHAH